MVTATSRKGITPVIAIVLLLMMTVAAAGAAYTWFSQMQQQLQSQARADLQTELTVRDIQCSAKPLNTIEISVSNSGSTSVDVSDVDVFIRGSGGHLNTTIEDVDLSTSSACNGGSCDFADPGGFATVTLNVTDPTYDDQPGSGSLTPDPSFLVAGSFYKVEASFNRADYTFNAGGCLAE